ncbi:HNH endonuclease [Nocardia africana]
MAGGEFTAPTKALVAARAGYMCSNPDCSRLLVGPELTEPDAYMKARIGEVAHIFGEKLHSARHDPTMSDRQRAAPENAIFLCPACHTLIDNNGGIGYPATVLVEWRDEHTRKVRRLLTSPRLPLLPRLMRREQNAEVVAHVFDVLADKRSLHEYAELETFLHVVKALGQIRTQLTAALRQVHDDDKLKSEIQAISVAARTFMKNVIVDESGQPVKGFDHAVRHLTVMREEIAAIVARLSDAFAVPVPPALQSQVWRDF